MTADAAGLVEAFGIANYQQQALTMLLDRTSLSGLRVLEVGGSNLPRSLTHQHLGAKEWVSVDIIGSGRYQLAQQSAHYADVGIAPLAECEALVGGRDYVILDGAIEDATNLPEGYFDAVISITSFEHVLAIPAALAAVRRAKTATAPFFTYHGPIWSGPNGHHVWVDKELNFNQSGWIEPHGHLLHSPAEIYQYLSPRYGWKRAQAVVLQMFHEPRINRLMYEDYEQLFAACLQEVDCQPYFVRPIADDVLQRLQHLHPRARRFDAYGMIAFCR